MAKVKNVVEEVKALASAPQGSFLELGAKLAKLQVALKSKDGTSERAQFDDLIEEIGIDRRKAYYLISISRAVADLNIPKKRLLALGWTKLMVMADHLTPNNALSLIEFAENNSVERLRSRMNGQEPIGHAILFRFTEGQFKLVSALLQKYGATRATNGSLANKEAAMLKIAELLK